VCLEGIDFEHTSFNARIKVIKQELKEGKFV